MATVIDKELMGMPREKHWISYIKQRIRKNKNFLGFVSGPTGSGKSYSTLRMCEEVDPEFNIDRCVFGGLELMNLINSGKLRRGNAIAFEEIGVEMSNRNWASVTNKMINYLLQTFRHQGFILIMNSVYMDFIDAHTRKLFHAEMNTLGIDFDKQEVLLKPQLLQYNSRMQKFYYKRLKVITKEGKLPVDVWRVAKPSESLRLAYEIKKKEYTSKLNEKIFNELETEDNKGNKKVLTDTQQEVLDLLKQRKTIEQIATSRGRSKMAIEISMMYIRKKGYQLKPVFGGNLNRKALYYEVIEPKSYKNGLIKNDLATH